MLKKLSNLSVYEWAVLLLALFSALMFVIGLCCPPPGQVHNTVLIGIGEMFAFATLCVALHAFNRGADATVKKGDIEITINNPDGDGNGKQ